MKKRTTELAERKKIRSEHHFAIGRVDRLPPRRIFQTFLVDRNPLGQPARHFVFSLLQCHDVTILVPQYRFPIGCDLQRGGGVCSDQSSKAHAQKALATRQSKRSNRKVFLFRKDLHVDRLFKLHLILFREGLSRIREQLNDIFTIDTRLSSIHANDQSRRLQDRELIKLLF